MTTTDDLVTDYLRRLEQASADLPAAEREELLDQIRGHIDNARTDERAGGAAYIRQVLDDLGSPQEVAAAAREQTASPRRGTFNSAAGRPISTSLTREKVAAVLLAVGWLVIFGWLIGVILAWASQRWNTRDKVIATLLGAPIWMGLAISHALFAHTTNSTSTTLPDTLGSLAVIAGLAISAWVGVVLVRRARLAYPS